GRQRGGEGEDAEGATGRSDDGGARRTGRMGPES
ncbi:MAG: hypothetical protein QOG94_1428, partial [Solirubrobacteraceae bacterium]|nr:hypothetical protein [Solirubrobacteraceae bacterium]